MSQYLIKHHKTNTCEGVEIQYHKFSALLFGDDHSVTFKILHVSFHGKIPGNQRIARGGYVSL